MRTVTQAAMAVARAAAAVGRLLADNPREVLFLSGLWLVWAGLHPWSPSAALLVPGIVLVAVAIFGVAASGRSTSEATGSPRRVGGVLVALIVSAIVGALAALGGVLAARLGS